MAAQSHAVVRGAVVVMAIGLALATAFVVVSALKPAATPPPSAALVCDSEQAARSAAREADRFRAARAREAERLNRPGTPARREGDTLVVRADGRDVASFTDLSSCDAPAGCGRWTFGGLIAVGGQVRLIVLLAYRDAPAMEIMVGPKGEASNMGRGAHVVSPDGRWLVSGRRGANGVGEVSIFAVSDGRLAPVAESDDPCRPVYWLDKARVEMSCRFEGGRYAVAQLQGGDRWVLKAPGRPDLDIPAIKPSAPASSEGLKVQGYRRLTR